MEDESFCAISAPRSSGNLNRLSSMSCMRSQGNNFQHQQTISQLSNINDQQNTRGIPSYGQNHQENYEHKASNIDTWNPMDDDFSCSTFNSYKNFDVLNVEHPNKKSQEKSLQQMPEKQAEEIHVYVGNIPLSITKEGIKNLFLTVGKVLSCAILPPKDPSYDNKYGFVEFSTWQDATKAIEIYDGFYVGCGKNLQVRVAHKRRGSDNYYAIKDSDHSSSDGAMAQDKATYNQHPPFNDSNNFDDEDHEVTTNQNFHTSANCPKEINHIDNEQILNISPRTELDSNEQTKGENLPKETRHESSTSPRAKLPCTCCEKLCTQRCSACKAPYCSRKCQKNDRARHKLTCTYEGSSPKPANSSAPAPAPAPVSEPEPEYEYDFDCIDISMDSTVTLRKDIVKDESKSAQASGRNILLDSGCTSPKENNGVAKPNEPCSEEVSADTGMVVRQPELLHANMLGAQESLEKDFFAYVTAVYFVNTIWAVVRTSDYPRFCEMTAKMAEITEENLEKITTVNMGSPCLARFSLDNCWYRSRILQGNSEQVEVIFVDYGNKEWKNIHDLYQLPPGIGDFPPQARQFSLHGVAPGSHSEIGQRMVKLLDGMVTSRTFLFEVVCTGPDSIPQVILRDPDAQESVNQQLINYLDQESSNAGSIPNQSNVQMTSSGNFSSNHSMANSATNDPKTGYASNQEPSVSKHHMASDVPGDILPSAKQFDIFVCHFATPKSFWVWFLDTAKERFQQLSLMLSETYDQSSYSDYLPVVGELIVAKFTDGVWYRAEVESINNDCTLKVTFIDFGNSEDVSLYETRRITEALAVIPKHATKCTLHGVEESGSWTAACNVFCNELMLNKPGSAVVQDKGQDLLVLKVDVEVDGEMKSVMDEVVKQGYFIPDVLQTDNSAVVPCNTPPEQTSLNKESARVCQPFASDNNRARPNNESVVPAEGQVLPSSQPVIASNQVLPLPTAPSIPFNVIVNDVLSADKFYAQMIDPDLVSQLKKCVRELNEHVTKNLPPKVENASIGHLGCARFSQDNVWYRAQIIKADERNYKVRFIDFGNIQDVHPDEFLEAPEFFYQLAPQAICCRLGIATNGIWGQRSQCPMERLTLNKQLLCTVIGGSSCPQYAVKLQSTVGDEVIDIAEELNKGMSSYTPVCATPRPSNTPSPPPSSSPVKTPSPRPASTHLSHSTSGKRQNKAFTEKVLNSAIFVSGIGEAGRTYEVYVPTIFHPTYFWVQDAKIVENIKRLQEELNSHYNNSSFPPFRPLLHSICVYISRNQCYRVFVRQATPKGFLVHCVDFGYQMLADEKYFRPLDEKFSSQPFGAILCSTDGVKPLDEKLWTDEAIRYFSDKIKSHRVAIRVRFNSKARLFVDVFDPESREECLLSTALIANGMAKLRSMKFNAKLQSAEADDKEDQQIQDSFLRELDCETAICEGNPNTEFGHVPLHVDIGDVRGKNPVKKQAPASDSNFHNPSQNPGPDTKVTLSNSSVVQPKPNQNQRSGLDYQSQSSNTNLISTSPGSCSRNPDSIHTISEIPMVSAGEVTSSIPVLIPSKKELHVFVSWVDSPDRFYVQLPVKETVQQYAVMGEQLHRMCENSSGSGHDVKVGDCYASKFVGEWYRCRIEALLGNGLARVFYVDFGNREDVELAKLRPLTDKFRLLPAQALQCALADVQPRESGWTPQTVQWLATCILNKTLVAVVVQTVDDVLYVRVYDNSNPAEVSINSLMAQSGV